MSELLTHALDAIRAERGSAAKLGFELIGVAGSVARGQERPDSDVDIAYDVVGRASLLGLARIVLSLQDRLEREVGVIDISRVDPEIRDELERGLVRA